MSNMKKPIETSEMIEYLKTLKINSLKIIEKDLRIKKDDKKEVQ